MFSVSLHVSYCFILLVAILLLLILLLLVYCYFSALVVFDWKPLLVLLNFSFFLSLHVAPFQRTWKKLGLMIFQRKQVYVKKKKKRAKPFPGVMRAVQGKTGKAKASGIFLKGESWTPFPATPEAIWKHIKTRNAVSMPWVESNKAVLRKRYALILQAGFSSQCTIWSPMQLI